MVAAHLTTCKSSFKLVSKSLIFYECLQTGKSDEFTGELLKIFETVRAEGIKQKAVLGLHRSDYMLHAVENDTRSMLQVELNTISSSFGGLSSKVSMLAIACFV